MASPGRLVAWVGVERPLQWAAPAHPLCGSLTSTCRACTSCSPACPPLPPPPHPTHPPTHPPVPAFPRHSGSDEDQAFVQNLAIFLAAFFRAHLGVLEGADELRAALVQGLDMLVAISYVDDDEVRLRSSSSCSRGRAAWSPPPLRWSGCRCRRRRCT